MHLIHCNIKFKNVKMICKLPRFINICSVSGSIDVFIMTAEPFLWSHLGTHSSTGHTCFNQSALTSHLISFTPSLPLSILHYCSLLNGSDLIYFMLF